MAAITDPEAIRFVNEVVRPLCELARELKVKCDAAKVAWLAGIQTKFANNPDTLEDGREAEGVSRLTALDIKNALTELNKITTGGASEWVTTTIQKPCVRMIP